MSTCCSGMMSGGIHSMDCPARYQRADDLAPGETSAPINRHRNMVRVQKTKSLKDRRKMQRQNRKAGRA